MTTYVLKINDAPKSVNASGGGARQNKYVAHKDKMRWEGVYGMALLAAKVPRSLGFTRITIELKFKDRRNRDAENFRHPTVKPLLDAMKKGDWIEDDTEEFVQVERVYLIEGPLDAGPLVKSQSVITLQVMDSAG